MRTVLSYDAAAEISDHLLRKKEYYYLTSCGTQLNRPGCYQTDQQ